MHSVGVFNRYLLWVSIQLRQEVNGFLSFIQHGLTVFASIPPALETLQGLVKAQDPPIQASIRGLSSSARAFRNQAFDWGALFIDFNRAV